MELYAIIAENAPKIVVQLIHTQNFNLPKLEDLVQVKV